MSYPLSTFSGSSLSNCRIFEGEATDDCLRLVTGPRSTSIILGQGTHHISSHYARVLAQLARQRGFDGYLLNFECHLKGRLNQSRALSTWVALLTNELKRTVGAHAQCVW